MATKKKPEYAESGQASKPKSDIGKLISDTSAWMKPRFADEKELLDRIAEYQNLCALKPEYPSVENLCLYLGVPIEEMREWRRGEHCSKDVKTAIDYFYTWVLSINNQRANEGKLPYVMRIWDGKQNHNEREPNSKLEDLLASSLLKDLPSSTTIAQRYLDDYDESEDETE